MNGAEELRQVVDALLHPGSALEERVLMAAVVLVSLFTYAKVSNAVDMPNTGPGYTALAVLFGLGFLLAGMLLGRLFLLPHVPAAAQGWALYGTGLAATVLVAVPLMANVQKCGYLSALIAWGLSLLAAALVAFVIGAAFDAFASGGRDVEKMKSRRQETEQFLKQ